MGQRRLGLAVAKRLLEGIEGEVGPQCGRRAPADKFSRAHIDQENDIDEAPSCQDRCRITARVRSVMQLS